MRAALLLAGLLALPIVAAGPSTQTGAYAGSWCDDHTPCWWYETCFVDPVETPCTGWLAAQHSWGFRICAGDEPALAAWVATGLDGAAVAGAEVLDANACVEERGGGSTALVDCAVVHVVLAPLGGLPVESHAFDCGSSFFTMG